MTHHIDRSLTESPPEQQTKDEIATDEQTAKRIEAGERREKALAEKGLLAEDGTIDLEPRQVKYDQPPGTEQMAG
jgi:hypothetical protein